MKGSGYLLLALTLTSVVWWAYRKGDSHGEAKSEMRTQRAQIEAQEVILEAHDEVDGLSDDAVRERLHNRARNRP